jgi:hypothetical protein
MLLITRVRRQAGWSPLQHATLALGLLIVGVVTPAPLAAALAAPSLPVSMSAALSTNTQAGCQVVHLGPWIAPGAAASSYFNLSLAPGTTVVEKMVVANPNPYRCGVSLSAALGTTAVNGGDSYAIVAPGQPCDGPACWLGRLPRTVIVPADHRVLAPFTIKVPARVTSGQYLAGVIGQSTAPPVAPRSGSTGAREGSVGASVVARVAIGVAITVPGALRSRLLISSVTVSPAGLAASNVDVTVRNTGNTWAHPKGTLTVALPGPDRSEPVSMGTVLPGDDATLSVAERSVPGGRQRVDITLNYDHGVGPATWRGALNFPHPPVTYARGGTITIVASSGLPTWATALLIGLAVVVVVFAGFLLLFWRRGQRREQAADGPLPGPPPPDSHELSPPPVGYPPVSPSEHQGADAGSPVERIGVLVPAPLVGSPPPGPTGSARPTDGR